MYRLIGRCLGEGCALGLYPVLLGGFGGIGTEGLGGRYGGGVGKVG